MIVQVAQPSSCSAPGGVAVAQQRRGHPVQLNRLLGDLGKTAPLHAPVSGQSLVTNRIPVTPITPVPGGRTRYDSASHGCEPLAERPSHSCRSLTHQLSCPALDQVAASTWIGGSTSRRSTSAICSRSSSLMSRAARTATRCRAGGSVVDQPGKLTMDHAMGSWSLRDSGAARRPGPKKLPVR
jgi:hypothetical protein